MQVAVYRNNTIHTTILPNIIKKIGMEYNEAAVLVEINDIGQQVSDMLAGDLDYENLIRVSSKPGAGQTIAGGFGDKKIKTGLKMSPATKRIGCSNLKSLIESDNLVIVDKVTIEELS